MLRYAGVKVDCQRFGVARELIVVQMLSEKPYRTAIFGVNMSEINI